LNLLLDENLSPRLTPRLAPLFPGLTHVRDVGLKQASDEAIWKWAKQNGYTIVTTDSDFVALSAGRGWPPKVVHLKSFTAHWRQAPTDPKAGCQQKYGRFKPCDRQPWSKFSAGFIE